MNKPSLAASSLALLAAASIAQAGGNLPHWGYLGPVDAAHWAELDPSFQACKLGTQQSPIDIETRSVAAADAKPMGFAYTAGIGEVVNNGHTVQVNLPASGSIGVGGAEYKLLQFHFHTPSEEKIDGQDFPLVAHLVHKSADGRLAVVAVLFKLGRENAVLAPVFDGLPAKEGDKVALPSPIDLAALLPADRAYYAFQGSLTTPPCSEDVSWHVLRTPVELSAGQLAAFRKVYAMNARPVQARNDRKVTLVR